MQTITLIAGISFGLVWKRRTGFGCGGIITPGILAVYADPERICLCILAGIILAPVVRLVSERLDIYGTERTGAAMIMALLLRYVLPINIGFVVPGLIACDVIRQGLIMTLCGTISCTLITIMMMVIL